MKHNVRKNRNERGNYLRRYAIPILGILLVVVLMAAVKLFNPSQSDKTT